MAVKVTLSNASRVTKSEYAYKVVDNVENIKIPRTLYQKLGSLIANKTLVDDYNNDRLPKEYSRLLTELSALHEFKYYGGIDSADPEIVALDNYLGELGNTETYPYEQDSIDIPQWLSLASTSEYRYLEVNGEVLTDNGELLIIYR